VADILGCQLVYGSSPAVRLGLHQEIGRGPFSPESIAVLNELFEALSTAARFDTELRGIGWRSCVDLHALDRLSAGVILSEADGLVRNINSAAERILRRSDGLSLRNGRLIASMHSKSRELDGLIAAATDSRPSSRIGRMIVQRNNRRAGYPVTVASLPVEIALPEHPMAMLVVADPDRRSRPGYDESALSELAMVQTRRRLAFMEWKSKQPGTQGAHTGTRYYFHVCNGSTFMDEKGSVFSTPEEAGADARIIANELAEDGKLEGVRGFGPGSARK
jgi:hypothetical protein